MAYWLMKSEPESFSIDDMMKKSLNNEVEGWDGVRNYQARNFMKQMQVGDLAFFYHSACKVPAIAGVIKVASAPYPDPTQFDPDSKYFDAKATIDSPRWHHVDVAFVQKFETPISLKEMKQNPMLDGMNVLKKGSRLSIMPVSEDHWFAVLAMQG